MNGPVVFFISFVDILKLSRSFHDEAIDTEQNLFRFSSEKHPSIVYFFARKKVKVKARLNHEALNKIERP
jgi:hypothetical protein